MDTNIHIRYCCGSKTLIDKFIELGFKEKGSDPDHMNTRQIRRFYKGKNLKIEEGYHGITLFRLEEIPGPINTKSNIWQIKYKGLSVNKELLENFAQKGIYNQ
jgi:hypothetical protein